MMHRDSQFLQKLTHKPNFLDIVDNLEEDPSSILDATIFDSMRSYIK